MIKGLETWYGLRPKWNRECMSCEATSWLASLLNSLASQSRLDFELEAVFLACPRVEGILQL